MPTDGLTYRDSGVNIETGDALVQRIRGMAKNTHGPAVLSGVGGFAALFSLSKAAGDLADPVLVSGADGVGTKLKVAFAADRHDTIGIDLVAMCVNDVITTGARPLFFLDYFATGRIEPTVAEQVITGIARGCTLADCALIGGETAEMPGVYSDGEYDLAGFAVGAVDRPAIVDGARVIAGDAVIGVASSGLHSNGYSLARKALLERAGLALDATPDGLSVTLGEALLEPTRIYARAVEALGAACDLRAVAHITGGGITGNLPRVLPAGTQARLDPRRWSRAPIFDLVQSCGDVAIEEMYRTFNMGLGLIVVVPAAQTQAALTALNDAGEVATEVGVIEAGAVPDAPATASLEGLPG